MVAEGHWDSQKASQRETRTTRASEEVQGDREVKGDRQERGEAMEEIQDTGIHRKGCTATGRRQVTDEK